MAAAIVAAAAVPAGLTCLPLIKRFAIRPSHLSSTMQVPPPSCCDANGNEAGENADGMEHPGVVM